MKIRKNFWSNKHWYTLEGGLWPSEKAKLSSGDTLEIRCKGYDGITRQGYYRNGAWKDTGNGK